MSTPTEIIEVLRSAFPAGAEFEAKQNARETVFTIDWPLGGGLRSKVVQLTISHEAMEDYLTSPNYRRLAEERLREFVRERLGRFRPEYDASRGSAPVEKWKVTTHQFETF